VNFSFNQINHKIHTNTEDNLEVTIALIAKVSLNHFINNNGDHTPEKTPIPINANNVFLSNLHIHFNSGISQKNNKTLIIVNI
jgi:hypothetical protein